ncbi:Hypothetical_protein [Hexamita inflata]|uniref:Hypothetical_protein n=1 Tax=Hexamita inflata TaxID=28002 RepID=A0AA86TXD6_9EUKA|nr:Hypothetical protein HINF_LOCUS20670 [Hexamita inflata]
MKFSEQCEKWNRNIHRSRWPKLHRGVGERQETGEWDVQVRKRGYIRWRVQTERIPREWKIHLGGWEVLRRGVESRSEAREREDGWRRSRRGNVRQRRIRRGCVKRKQISIYKQYC